MKRVTRYDMNNQAMLSFCAQQVPPHAHLPRNGTSVALYNISDIEFVLHKKLEEFKYSTSAQQAGWKARWKHYLVILAELKEK